MPKNDLLPPETVQDDEEIVDLLDVVTPGKAPAPSASAPKAPAGDFGADLDAMLDDLARELDGPDAAAPAGPAGADAAPQAREALHEAFLDDVEAMDTVPMARGGAQAEAGDAVNEEALDALLDDMLSGAPAPRAAAQPSVPVAPVRETGNAGREELLARLERALEELEKRQSELAARLEAREAVMDEHKAALARQADKVEAHAAALAAHREEITRQVALLEKRLQEGPDTSSHEARLGQLAGVVAAHEAMLAGGGPAPAAQRLEELEARCADREKACEARTAQLEKQSRALSLLTEKEAAREEAAALQSAQMERLSAELAGSAERFAALEETVARQAEHLAQQSERFAELQMLLEDVQAGMEKQAAQAAARVIREEIAALLESPS